MPHKPPAPTRAELRDAIRHLRARPPAHPDDLIGVRLPGEVERGVLRVERLRPVVAAAVPRLVLVAAAQQPPPGGCRWCRARPASRVHRVRLQLDQPTRALLGPMCLACRAALLPKPRPKPRPKPHASRATAPARTSPAPRRRLVVDVPTLVASAAGAPSPGITPEQAIYNQQRGAALGLPPASIAHLTRATAPAR
jgi:hypothetical protein